MEPIHCSVNARLICSHSFFSGKEYTNLQEVYEALTNREVKGILIDAFTVGSKKELFNRRDLRISKLLDYSAAYGAALGGEAKKLQKCFQEYVGEQRSEISKIVQENAERIEVIGIVVYSCFWCDIL